MKWILLLVAMSQNDIEVMKFSHKGDCDSFRDTLIQLQAGAPTLIIPLPCIQKKS